MDSHQQLSESHRRPFRVNWDVYNWVPLTTVWPVDPFHPFLIQLPGDGKLSEGTSEADPPSPQFAHPWTDPQSLSHLHQSAPQQPACCPSWRCGWPGSQLQTLGTHWQCSRSHRSCCGRSLSAPGKQEMLCQCLHSTKQPPLHFKVRLKSSCSNASEDNPPQIPMDVPVMSLSEFTPCSPDT